MRQTAASTRERLLVSARQIVEAEGYGGASVIAVAQRAGVATGTLYRHFPSKAELFAELFRVVCEHEVDAGYEAARSAGGSAVERLETVIATFAERAMRVPRLAWALIAEPVDPLVDAERLAYRKRYAELIAELLREGIAGGEMPAQNVELTAAALVGGAGEALVGPLSPIAGSRPATPELLADLRTFVRRAVGA
jgi:AcrR family transcriptional regulator